MNAQEQALLQELDAALAKLPEQLSREEVESLLHLGNYQILNSIQDRIIPDHSNSTPLTDADFVFRAGGVDCLMTMDQVALGCSAFYSSAEDLIEFSQYQNHCFFSYQLAGQTYNNSLQPTVALSDFIQMDAEIFQSAQSNNVTFESPAVGNDAALTQVPQTQEQRALAEMLKKRSANVLGIASQSALLGVTTPLTGFKDRKI